MAAYALTQPAEPAANAAGSHLWEPYMGTWDPFMGIWENGTAGEGRRTYKPPLPQHIGGGTVSPPCVSLPYVGVWVYGDMGRER